jgi:hypothetical protein
MDFSSFKFLRIIKKERAIAKIAKREAIFREKLPAEIMDLLVKTSRVGLRIIKKSSPLRGLIRIKTINKNPKIIKNTSRGLVKKKVSQRNKKIIARPPVPIKVSLKDKVFLLDIIVIL